MGADASRDAKGNGDGVEGGGREGRGGGGGWGGGAPAMVVVTVGGGGGGTPGRPVTTEERQGGEGADEGGGGDGLAGERATAESGATGEAASRRARAGGHHIDPSGAPCAGRKNEGHRWVCFGQPMGAVRSAAAVPRLPIVEGLWKGEAVGKNISPLFR